MKNNLKEIFDEQIVIENDELGYPKEMFKALVTHVSEERVQMLFVGMELILKSDGTYFIIDTTGG